MSKMELLVDEAKEHLDDLQFRLGQIKDEAMDNDLDELASELNATANNCGVFVRRLLHLKEKYKY